MAVPFRTILRAMLLGLLLRCPRCARGRMMQDWVRLAPACGSCGLVFEYSAGDWSGAVMIAQMLMGLAAIPVFLLLTWTTSLDFTARVVWTVILVVALWALTYRNIKGLWFGWLHIARDLGQAHTPRP